MEQQDVDCSVCMEPFDEQRNSPRTLRCGHTLCSPCIEVLLAECIAERNCPECRKPLKITSVSHLPVSYTILRMAGALAKANEEPPVVRIRTEDGEVCTDHGGPIISYCRACRAWMCPDCRCDDEAGRSVAVVEALLHVKRGFVEKTEDDVKYLNERKKELEKERGEADRQTARLQKTQRLLGKRLKKLQEAIGKVEEFEALAVEAGSSRRLQRLIDQGTTYVADVRTWFEELPQLASAISDLSLANNRGHIFPRRVPPHVASPRNFAELKERLTISQNMYARLDVAGTTRWSKLSIQGGFLLLHSLVYTPPPTPAVTEIPFVEVMKYYMNSRVWKTFMDLHSEGRHEGRVFFLMLDRSQRAINFVRLCTGESSPGYNGVMLYNGHRNVLGVERTYPLIKGGVELDDSRTVNPFYEGDEDIDDRAISPGLVTGSKPQEHGKEARFNVDLYCKTGNDPNSFGIVTNGLDILRQYYHTIIKQNPQPFIGDCGVMLPLS